MAQTVFCRRLGRRQEAQVASRSFGLFFSPPDFGCWRRVFGQIFPKAKHGVVSCDLWGLSDSNDAALSGVRGHDSAIATGKPQLFETPGKGSREGEKRHPIFYLPPYFFGRDPGWWEDRASSVVEGWRDSLHCAPRAVLRAHPRGRLLLITSTATPLGNIRVESVAPGVDGAGHLLSNILIQQPAPSRKDRIYSPVRPRSRRAGGECAHICGAMI